MLLVELAVMAFLAAVPSFVIALRGITDPRSIDLDIGVLELVATVLAALGPAAMAVYLLWRDNRLHAAGFGRRPLGFVTGYGALGAVCCFIALVSIGLVVSAVILATGGDLDDGSGDADALELTAGVVLAGIAISIVAGIGEEIVFRAYAISRLEEAGYARAAMWAPWAVFTSLHLYQGPLAVVVIGAVAAVFVWLYRWKRSVWPVMVAHALYNLVIILVGATAG